MACGAWVCLPAMPPAVTPPQKETITPPKLSDRPAKSHFQRVLNREPCIVRTIQTRPVSLQVASPSRHSTPPATRTDGSTSGQRKCISHISSGNVNTGPLQMYRETFEYIKNKQIGTYCTLEQLASIQSGQSPGVALGAAMLDQPDLGSIVRFVMNTKTSPHEVKKNCRFVQCNNKTRPPKPNMCCGAAPASPRFYNHPRIIKGDGQLAKELSERLTSARAFAVPKPRLHYGVTHRDPAIGNQHRSNMHLLLGELEDGGWLAGPQVRGKR